VDSTPIASAKVLTRIKEKKFRCIDFSPDCRTVAGQTWVGVIQSIKAQMFSLVIMPERQEQKKGEPLKDGSPFVNLL
jgi:hypothetical protein